MKKNYLLLAVVPAAIAAMPMLAVQNADVTSHVQVTSGFGAADLMNNLREGEEQVEYKVYNLEKPGTLDSLMGESKADLTAVKVVGQMNYYDYIAFKGHKKIQYLDFSEAEIVAGPKSWQKPNELQYEPFTQLKTLKEVKLPKNLEIIGSRCFASSGIEKMVIPETVTKIDMYGVAWCDNLKEIVIPSSMKELANYSFATCKSLSKVVIKDGLTVLKSAFGGCSAITSIQLPATLTEVSGGAFSGMSILPELTLPESVTKVGKGFIDGCTALKKLKVMAAVPPTAEADFFKQETYQNVELLVPEDALQAYEDHVAWSNFKKITSFKQIKFDGVYHVEVPGTLDSLMADKKAELVNVKVTGTIDSRDYRVFKTSCPKLEYLDLGEAQIVAYKSWKANQLEGEAFSGMKTLKQIILPNGVEQITSRCFQGSGLTSISFPESLKQLDIYSFAFCPELELVELPGSLQKMENYSFVSNPKIKKVVMKEGMTNIGAYAFRNCPSLTDIEWPSTMKVVNGGAFGKCTSLEKLNLPASVDSVGNGIVEGCTKLASITLNSVDAPKVSSAAAFDQDTYKKVVLFVPEESKQKYEDHVVWSQFMNLYAIGEIPESIAEVTDNQFKAYPLNGAIRIEMAQASDLYIYDMTGNLVYKNYVNQNATVSVAPGIYVLRVGDEVLKVSVK